MAASLNLHRVFTGAGGYLDAVRVPEEDAHSLRLAREEIRAVLSAAFGEWEEHVSQTELFEAAMLKSLAPLKLPRPKFRLQGSFAYHTVNDCQENPPQQIDQDDGVFLPIGFLASGGRVQPTIVAKAYFKLVEDALRPLCTRKGWTLNPGRAKDTCVRVEIGPRTHIDLPLYAIRDEAFEALAETVIAKAMANGLTQDGATELFDEVYRGLGDTEIMLAHRTEGWIGSDPRRLENWFDNAVATFDEQVRRLSRAYKAMRDAQGSSSDLRSICIMAALVTALERVGSQDQIRDDLALLNTAREMVKVFAEPIENPVFPGDNTKCLCAGWTQEFRVEVQALFARVADELDAAIHGTLNREVALAHVQAVFGARVPTDPTLISMTGLAAAILSDPPKTQPRPMPVRTKSG